jgi:hypothetical protein
MDNIFVPYANNIISKLRIVFTVNIQVFLQVFISVQPIARWDYNAYKDNILKQEHNPESWGTKADVNQVLFSYLD